MGSRAVTDSPDPIPTHGRTSWDFMVTVAALGAGLAVALQFQGKDTTGPWNTLTTLTPTEPGATTAVFPDIAVPAWAALIRVAVTTATADIDGVAPVAEVACNARWFDPRDANDKAMLLSEVQGYDQLENLARRAEAAAQALAFSANPFRFFGGNIQGRVAGSMGGTSYPANVMQPQPIGGFGAGYGPGVFGPYGSTAVPLVDHVDPKLAEWMGGVAVAPILDVNFNISGFLAFLKDKIAAQTEYLYQTMIMQRDPSPSNVVSLRERPALAPGLADGFDVWKNQAGKGWKGRG